MPPSSDKVACRSCLHNTCAALTPNRPAPRPSAGGFRSLGHHCLTSCDLFRAPRSCSSGHVATGEHFPNSAALALVRIQNSSDNQKARRSRVSADAQLKLLNRWRPERESGFISDASGRLFFRNFRCGYFSGYCRRCGFPVRLITSPALAAIWKQIWHCLKKWGMEKCNCLLVERSIFTPLLLFSCATRPRRQVAKRELSPSLHQSTQFVSFHSFHARFYHPSAPPCLLQDRLCVLENVVPEENIKPWL